MKLPINKYNKTDFPYLDDSQVGKPIPFMYGTVSAIKLESVNPNEDENNGSKYAVYRLPDFTTNIGTAYVEQNDVLKSANVVSVDYSAGILIISNGRESSGQSLHVKLVNCIGYVKNGHSYPKDVLEHIFATFANKNYTSSNYNIAQWESELANTELQCDLGFLVSSEIDLWQLVYEISIGSRKVFRADLDSSGKIRAKVKDFSRASSRSIASCDILNADNIVLKKGRDSVYSKVITDFAKNYYDDVSLQAENTTYEIEVRRDYRKESVLENKTFLVNRVDAEERSYHDATAYSRSPVVTELKLFGNDDIELYDVITVTLQPDNLSSSSRRFAGNRDCLVLSINPDIENEMNTVTVMIIENRVPFESQSAVMSTGYTTIERQKSSVEIMIDEIELTPGPQGNGIESTDISYQIGSSGETPPSGTWLASPPSTSPGDFLWTRTVLTYTDTTSVTSYSVSAHGQNGTDGTNGVDGTDGRGISSTSITYQVGTSGTTAPTGTWVSSPPATTTGQFLWTRTIITYTDSTTSTSYSVSAHGATGATGATGPQGASSLTLGIILNASTFAAEGSNTGEVYVHGYSTAGVAQDINGSIIFKNTAVSITKGAIDTNVAFDGYILAPKAGGSPVAAICRISNQTWYSVVAGTLTALTESNYFAIGEMINTAAETTESARLYPTGRDLVDIRTAINQSFAGVAGSVTNGSGAVSIYQAISSTQFSASGVSRRVRPGACVFVRGGTLNQAGSADSVKALRVFDGYYWESPRTEDYEKYRQLAGMSLLGVARIYSASSTVPADCGTFIDFLIANAAVIGALSSQKIQFQEYIASIADTTLVARAGSTPGTRQVYMGKNPRYPNDATREYEFAMQEFLGMDGSTEVWMKHFWTKFLSTGMLALTLSGCVQANGNITSSPGVVWENVYNAFGTIVFNTVAYGNGKWVLGGSSGRVAYSTDGQTFTLGTSGFGTTPVLGVAYGNGLWVIVGGGGKIAYSTDGQTFTLGTSNLGTDDILSVAYGNGRWIIGGYKRIAYSIDGQTFTLSAAVFTGSVTGIAYGNGKWVATSYTYIYYSTDGQTFTLGTSGFGTTPVLGVAYGNGLWVIVGGGGGVNRVAYSTDGQTFTLGTSGFGIYTIRAVAYGNGRWVIVGNNGQINCSTDGKTFLAENVQQVYGANGTIWGVSSDANGRFVAVGNNSTLGTGVILRSDPLEAGGGVVGKVYDTVHGELNKLWDGRFFQSYASAAEVPPLKYFQFQSTATGAAIYAEISPFIASVVGTYQGCIGQITNGVPTTYGLTAIQRLNTTTIRLFDLNSTTIFDIYSTQGAIGHDLQIAFIPYVNV